MNEWRKQYPNPPLREPSRGWFVNRKRQLDFLWKWASNIPEPRSKGSHAITGLRRTGKSSLMAKLYNRLFFEQEKVVPIYISFAQYLPEPKPIDAQKFAREFVTGAIRSYLAFTYKQPQWQSEQPNYSELEEIVSEISDKVTQKWLSDDKRALKDSVVPSHNLVQWCINFLDAHAHRQKQPLVIMIDEFQVLTEVLYPEDGRVMNITGSFQRASESWEAPLLVSGSSVSMLQGQALGGLLSGRFSPTHVGALESVHAVEMVFHLGQHTGIPVTNELAEAIVEATQGYPYAIERLMFSKSPDVERFPDVAALSAVVEFELLNHDGALGRHYAEEYGKYVTELNGDEITRKILYWITYTDPSDPLLRIYLNAFHNLKVDDLSAGLLASDDAVRKIRRQLRELQGEINRKTGHFTEIIVAGVIRSFDHRTVDGETYFSTAGEVILSRCRDILRREGVVKRDKTHEIGIMAEYDIWHLPEDTDYDSNAIYGAWMVSVRYRDKRMGVREVQAFMNDVAVVQSEKGYGEVVRWYFSKSGFTEEAKALLRTEGIYFSDLAQFNQLADIFSLMQLEM